MKIKIWSLSNSDEENADEIEVEGSPEDGCGWFWDRVEFAVQEFAEWDYPRSDYWDNEEFMVRVGDVVKTYSVEVQMEPSFCVAEKKAKATG